MSCAHNHGFDAFFTSDFDESISPFLTVSSKRWARNLSLKASILSAILLLIAYMASTIASPLEHLLLVGIYFISGTPSLLHSIEDLKKATINIDILMTLAAFLAVFIGSGLEGALLLVLFHLSGAMEESVSKKAMGALHNLHDIAPSFATVIDNDGRALDKSVKDIAVGTRVLVKAGEVVPLDGTVVSGSSFVNLVHLTGESVPVAKRAGDHVAAGARNLDGTLTVEVEKTNAQSTLSQIIGLIRQAQEMKPKLQRFLDRFSKSYASSIIALFFFFALALPWILGIPYLTPEGSIYRSLTFLIAASPCALIIATPTAYLSAISACARSGVLMKGGITLDALASCTTIAFDKTGTLTTGELTCQSMRHLKGPGSISEKTALGIAAALETHVTHPLGLAVCNYARAQKAPHFTVSSFRNVSGYGVEGSLHVDERELRAFVGNASYLDTELEVAEETTAFLQVEDDVFAFTFTDTIRPNMRKTLAILKKQLGLQTVMITGDHKRSADKVAKTLGIDEYYADLRPDAKLKKIEELNTRGHLAMVGDGINDAPSLTRANVGIALGTIGSATAIDAADIVLLNDTMTVLPWLIRRARKTSRLIKQNLTVALGVIALVTTPALLGLVPLGLAVTFHEGSTLAVGLNSLRLLRRKKTSKM